ncbi:hypothetical protein FOZ62_013068, partial [Perkinsus olseni]
GLDLEKLAKEVSTEMITSEAAVAEAEAELSNKGGTKISGVEDGHHGADGHRRRPEHQHSDEEHGGDEVDDDRADGAIGEISGEHADDGSLGGPRSYAGHLEQMDYRGHEEDNRSEHRDGGDHQGDQNDEEDHQGDQHDEEDHESDQRVEEADRSSGMDDDYRRDGDDHSHQSEGQDDGEETEGEGGNDKYEYLDGVKKLFKKEGKEADSSSFVHKKMKVHAHTPQTTAAPGSFIQTGPDGEEEEDDDEGQQEERGEDDGDEERENGDEEIEEKEDKD